MLCSDVVVDIAVLLDLPDIASLSATNRWMWSLLSSDTFWLCKTKRDSPYIISSDGRWRSLYQEIVKSTKLLRTEFPLNTITLNPITHLQYLRDLKSRSESLLFSNDPQEAIITAHNVGLDLMSTVPPYRLCIADDGIYEDQEYIITLHSDGGTICHCYEDDEEVRTAPWSECENEIKNLLKSGHMYLSGNMFPDGDNLQVYIQSLKIICELMTVGWLSLFNTDYDVTLSTPCQFLSWLKETDEDSWKLLQETGEA